MRYSIIRIGESGLTTNPSFGIPIISELGSKDLRFPNDNFNTSTFTVVNEVKGIKIAHGRVSFHTGTYDSYMLIPETHLYFNSGMLIQTFDNANVHSQGTVYEGKRDVQQSLYDLYESIKSE